MCDELVNTCGLKDDDKRFADCKSIKEAIGTVKKDGSKADLWNAQVSSSFIPPSQAYYPLKY